MPAQLKLIRQQLKLHPHTAVSLINPPATDTNNLEFIDGPGFHNSYISQQTWCRHSADKHQHTAFADALTTQKVILFLSKEKQYTHALLHNIISLINCETELWLVGHNKAGAKSAGKLLKTYFNSVTKLAMGGHCTLWRAINPKEITDKFNIEALKKTWDCHITRKEGDHMDMHVTSIPGVFSHGRLDPGTQLMLETLPTIKASNVLDFGSGSGVISLFQSQLNPNSRLTLIDDSALALQASSINLSQSTQSVTYLPSLNQAKGRYDLILSNPPFHQGIVQTLDISLEFIRTSAQLLNQGGQMFLVANRFLKYADTLHKHFSCVKRHTENNHFIVWHVIK